MPGPSWRVVQAIGLVVILMGLLPVVWTFVSFVGARGTPIPGAFTQELVVRGFNCYVRNPIYLGVLAIVVGEALVLGQWQLLAYAAGVWLVAAGFVLVYEEPALAARFGAITSPTREPSPPGGPRARPRATSLTVHRCRWTSEISLWGDAQHKVDLGGIVALLLDEGIPRFRSGVAWTSGVDVRRVVVPAGHPQLSAAIGAGHR